MNSEMLFLVHHSPGTSSAVPLIFRGHQAANWLPFFFAANKSFHQICLGGSKKTLHFSYLV